MSTSFDAIVIGTGQAGPYITRRLAASGMKVAIVERKLFGGTCVNTGCIPTKAMVASAYAACIWRGAVEADFGVQIEGGLRVDMQKVSARKAAISAQSRNGLENSLKTLANCTVSSRGTRGLSRRMRSARGRGADRGGAHFSSTRGGRAVVPKALPGVEDIAYLTNSSMMGVDFLAAAFELWYGRGAISGWSSDRCSGGSGVK